MPAGQTDATDSITQLLMREVKTDIGSRPTYLSNLILNFAM